MGKQRVIFLISLKGGEVGQQKMGRWQVCSYTGWSCGPTFLSSFPIHDFRLAERVLALTSASNILDTMVRWILDCSRVIANCYWGLGVKDSVLREFRRRRQRRRSVEQAQILLSEGGSSGDSGVVLRASPAGIAPQELRPEKRVPGNLPFEAAHISHFSR
jgi:hypothetical protein